MHVLIPFSSVVRSGASISDLSLRSKYAIVLFLISVNIFSAQLWSDTCKKFSPIEYIECTLVREQDLNQPDYEYLPDILKDGFVRYVFLKDQNAHKGSFFNYVVQILSIIDHLPTPCCDGIFFIVIGESLHTFNISSTTYAPRLFNVVKEV